MDEQKKLWKIGRDDQGNEIPGAEIVTRAPPGSSWHNFGLAVDSCWRGLDPYLEYLAQRDGAAATKQWYDFGRFAANNGLEWAGTWSTIQDKPHCQIRYGMTLKDAQDLYQKGGLESVWQKCNNVIKGS